MRSGAARRARAPGSAGDPARGAAGRGPILLAVAAPHEIPATRWPTRAEARAARLFQPLRAGAFTARTRTWVPAMVPWRATEDGLERSE